MEPGTSQREAGQKMLNLVGNPVPLQGRKCPVGQERILLDPGLLKSPGIEKHPGKQGVHDDVVGAAEADGDAALMLRCAEVKMA